MNEEMLRNLLHSFKKGEMSLDLAVKRLKTNFTEDLGFALVDHHRELRQGFPEVIFGQGKSVAQMQTIIR